MESQRVGTHERALLFSDKLTSRHLEQGALGCDQDALDLKRLSSVYSDVLNVLIMMTS